MIHAGHAGHTIEELYELIKCRSIHIPSPLRLLRLINGKRCEICNKKQVHYVRPGYGVFACWPCTTKGGLTKAWNKTWVRYTKDPAPFDAVFRHPRVSMSEYGSKNYMWAEPRTDATNESIGPLVCLNDVDQIVRHEQGIEDYLENVLHVPSVSDYDEYVNTYRDTKARAEREKLEREERKKARAKQSKDNKKANIDKMISDLISLVDEQWRDTALKHRENMFFSAKSPRVTFLSSFVDNLLKPYVISPSKMKKKILVEIAEQINSQFRRIFEKDFLSFGFLSDKDPFEAALKRSRRESFPSLEAVVDGHYADERFFKFLEEDRLVAASIHLKGRHMLYYLLLSEDQALSVNMRNLANTVWHMKKDGDSTDETIEKHSKETFTASRATFEDAKAALSEYRAHLENKSHDSEMVDRALYGVCECWWRTECLDLLLKKNFDALDEKNCVV
jgi:hypothetical protein